MRQFFYLFIIAILLLSFLWIFPIACGTNTTSPSSPSSLPKSTPTFTNTPTVTFTQTATSTPSNLIVSGAITFSTGQFTYGNCHILSGGTLWIDGSVTINAINGFSLDSGGTIYGSGLSPTAGSGFPVKCCGGGGHGGPGGQDDLGDAGGSANDNPLNPILMGSASWQGNGGALIMIQSLNASVSLNGSVQMDGGAQGGAGGTIYVMSDFISGTGSLSAVGANYGTGGGGGGGIILLSSHTSNTFSGTYSVNGGNGCNSSCGSCHCSDGGNGDFNSNTF